MTQQEQIEQAKVKLKNAESVVERLVFAPMGMGQSILDNIKDALALLESAKAEPPAGENGCLIICKICNETIKLSEKAMSHAVEIIGQHQELCAAKMRDRLDAQQIEKETQQQEIEKLKDEPDRKINRIQE